MPRPLVILLHGTRFSSRAANSIRGPRPRIPKPTLHLRTVGGRCARSSSATVVGEAVQVRCADGEARYGSRAAETALSSAVKAGRSCLAVVCRISRSTDQ